MSKNYLSAIYDLTSFGIFNISNAIVISEIDENVSVDVSFDGGNIFQSVDPLHTKFKVENSTGKIQVRITFNDVESPDIYMVKSTGFFQNLSVGSTINFTKLTTNENYSTTLGRNGYYNISLPRGTYDVWTTNSGKREVVMTSFNPETVVTPTKRLDKEALIEMTFKEVDWAKYSVFDTFEDKTKMIHGDAIIDTDGDLSDGVTNRKCRYWAVGFE